MNKILFVGLTCLLTSWFSIAANVCAQDKPDEKSAGKQPADTSPQEPAADEKPAQDESSGEDWSKLSNDEALAKVQELAASFDKESAEFRKALKDATPEERAKLLEKAPAPKDIIPKFEKLAELFPQSETSAKALLWIVQRQPAGPAYERAFKKLISDHADQAELKQIVMRLQIQLPSQATTEKFEKLLADVQNPELRAVAQFSFLQYQKRAAQIQKVLAKRAAAADDKEKPPASNPLADYLKDFQPIDESTRISELEKLSAEFGAVEISKGRTLGSAIEGELFEAQHLQIGMTPPDIEAEDIDGESFKLSDYRGKVVVLDFWGDW